jgi:carbon-monoxide dehydrogenase small subunit
MRRVTVTLNGTSINREVQDSRLLIEFLREDLKLTGTKESCGVGVCGACTCCSRATR